MDPSLQFLADIFSSIAEEANGIPDNSVGMTIQWEQVAGQGMWGTQWMSNGISTTSANMTDTDRNLFFDSEFIAPFFAKVKPVLTANVNRQSLMTWRMFPLTGLAQIAIHILGTANQFYPIDAPTLNAKLSTRYKTEVLKAKNPGRIHLTFLETIKIYNFSFRTQDAFIDSLIIMTTAELSPRRILASLAFLKTIADFLMFSIEEPVFEITSYAYAIEGLLTDSIYDRFVFQVTRAGVELELTSRYVANIASCCGREPECRHAGGFVLLKGLVTCPKVISHPNLIPAFRSMTTPESWGKAVVTYIFSDEIVANLEAGLSIDEFYSQKMRVKGEPYSFDHSKDDESDEDRNFYESGKIYIQGLEDDVLFRI